MNVTEIEGGFEQHGNCLLAAGKLSDDEVKGRIHYVHVLRGRRMQRIPEPVYRKIRGCPDSYLDFFAAASDLSADVALALADHCKKPLRRLQHGLKVARQAKDAGANRDTVIAVAVAGCQQAPPPQQSPASKLKEAKAEIARLQAAEAQHQRLIADKDAEIARMLEQTGLHLAEVEAARKQERLALEERLAERGAEVARLQAALDQERERREVATQEAGRRLLAEAGCRVPPPHTAPARAPIAAGAGLAAALSGPPAEASRPPEPAPVSVSRPASAPAEPAPRQPPTPAAPASAPTKAASPRPSLTGDLPAPDPLSLRVAQEVVADLNWAAIARLSTEEKQPGKGQAREQFDRRYEERWFIEDPDGSLRNLRPLHRSMMYRFGGMYDYGEYDRPRGFYFPNALRHEQGRVLRDAFVERLAAARAAAAQPAPAARIVRSPIFIPGGPGEPVTPGAPCGPTCNGLNHYDGPVDERPWPKVTGACPNGPYANRREQS